MPVTEQDRHYIRQTFELAKKAEGLVSPNPMVGAVIVCDGKVLATGYHQSYGQDHAERMAILKLAKNKPVKNCAQGASLYVSLEPCSHQGKTPPCTELIIEAGIQKVYFAVKDPNPKVTKKDPVKILTAAGVQVNYPILENEALELNKVFFKNILNKQPYYILKTAMSLDGKIATSTGESKWITSEKSREFVHGLRYAVDAVLVGVNTIIQDDPRLSVRLSGKKKNIYRIILDTTGRIPRQARVIKENKDKKTILVVGDDLPKTKLEKLKKLKISLLLAPVVKKTKQIDLAKLGELLLKLSIASVLVEGGSAVADSFVRSGLLSEYYCFIKRWICC